MNNHFKQFLFGLLILLKMVVYWLLISLGINFFADLRNEFYDVIFYFSIIFSFWLNLLFILFWYNRNNNKSFLGFFLLCLPYLCFLSLLQFAELNIPRLYDFVVLIIGYSIIYKFNAKAHKMRKHYALIIGYLLLVSVTYTFLYNNIWYYYKKGEEVHQTGLGEFNLKIKDRKGFTVNLANFKNKTIFVDMWASSCGNCIASMPDFEKLNQTFKSDNNYKIISLYCPIRKEQSYEWFLDYIDRKFEYDIDYYYIEYEDFNKLNIRLFPEFLIIGKSGNLAYRGQITYLPYIADNIYTKLKFINENDTNSPNSN